MQISARIFSKMAEKGITQKDLSEGTGINTRTISAWKVKKTNPSADKIECISRFLDVSIDWLITGKGQANSVNVSGTFNDSSVGVQGFNNSSVVFTNGTAETISKEASYILETYEYLTMPRRIKLLTAVSELRTEQDFENPE